MRRHISYFGVLFVLFIHCFVFRIAKCSNSLSITLYGQNKMRFVLFSTWLKMKTFRFTCIHSALPSIQIQKQHNKNSVQFAPNVKWTVNRMIFVFSSLIYQQHKCQNRCRTGWCYPYIHKFVKQTKSNKKKLKKK